MFKTLSFATFAAAMSASSALAATEISWWHAMDAQLGQKLEAIAEAFNSSQSEYKVVPTYKGSYPETLTSAITAFRADEQPHIVQVFEVGTGTMMAAEGRDLADLPADGRHRPQLRPGFSLPADDRRATIPIPEGNMLSFPFNSSTPIMYYNKDVFEAAGLDREQPRRRPGPRWKRPQSSRSSSPALPPAVSRASWIGLAACSRIFTAMAHDQPDGDAWRTASPASTRSSPSTSTLQSPSTGTTSRSGQDAGIVQVRRSLAPARMRSCSSTRASAPSSSNSSASRAGVLEQHRFRSRLRHAALL
jgi:sn-glycerol 3-phosphate transport system substrate-binding protein